MARKHNEDEVLRALASKKDIKVGFTTIGNTIRILSDRVYDPKNDCMIDNHHKVHDLGNGSWGKIDFLVNYCGYSIVHVDKF